jgi:hypothetical protein
MALPAERCIRLILRRWLQKYDTRLLAAEVAICGCRPL